MLHLKLSYNEINAFDKNGIALDADAYIGTGCILKSDDTEYAVIVIVDTDGSGIITAADARFPLGISAGLE